MTRRNIELMLLLIASPIVIVLFAMMVVTGGQELSFNTLGVPLGIFAAFRVAHMTMRGRRVARLGSHSGPTFHVNTESISRLAAR